MDIKYEFVTTDHLILHDHTNQLSFIKELTRISDDMEALEEFAVICARHMIPPQQALDGLLRKSSWNNLKTQLHD